MRSAVSYSGPDSANASVSGTCTDHAGNSGSRSLGFSYDDTVPQVTSATPSRSADHGGWYNHTFSITFAGADATSGVDTCTQATYSGPDDATASVNGTCRDRAGNTSAPFPFNFQYDATDPTVTATPSRNPDSNGWYNHPLSVGFAGSDAVSGIESCVPPQTYSGPDSANASVSGTCQDHAGNTGSRAFSLSYDGTGPVVTATPSRAPDSNGWYNHVLTVSLQRHGRDVGPRFLRPGSELLRPRRPDRLCERFLRRPSPGTRPRGPSGSATTRPGRRCPQAPAAPRTRKAGTTTRSR